MNVLRAQRLFAAAVVSAIVVVTVMGPPTRAASAATGEFGWPLRPRPHVVTAFDRPEHDWLPGHRGVDLAAEPGQSVLVVGDGTVVFAGSVAGKPVVSIDHANGLRSTYEPVAASVGVGARVFRGDIIGTVVSGHDTCVGDCLHWGIKRGRQYLDPTASVRSTPIRLKPLAPS